ncbi:MAG: barstar family protein [Mycobacterium sp.]|nr:barstar family protein [Mycobacterium sp.]
MRTYRIDGTRIRSKADFFTEIGRAVNGDDGYFGSNLDALADCLRGGFGTPEEGGFRFVLTSYKPTRAALGAPVWGRLLRAFTDAQVDLWLENAG